MKGFKNTKTGPIYGDFNLSSGTPMVGNTTPQRFARGGLVGRAEPSNDLDAESGGKTPLRPGYNKGGKVGLLKSLRDSDSRSMNEFKESIGDRSTRKSAPTNDRSRGLRETEAYLHRLKKKYAEGGKVSSLKKVYQVYDKKTGKNIGKPKSSADEGQKLRDKMDTKAGTYAHGFKEVDAYAEGGKVGALKQLAGVKEARKMAADDMRAMRKSNPEAAKDAARVVKSARRSRGTPFAGGGSVGRDAKTGRFAKGGMVGCGFNRKPMIGK